MRISDWSSDVCSSDLTRTDAALRGSRLARAPRHPVSFREPRLCELRRFPWHSELAEAKATSQGTAARGRGLAHRGTDRRSARSLALACDVAFLARHRHGPWGAEMPNCKRLRYQKG